MVEQEESGYSFAEEQLHAQGEAMCEEYAEQGHDYYDDDDDDADDDDEYAPGQGPQGSSYVYADEGHAGHGQGPSPRRLHVAL